MVYHDLTISNDQNPPMELEQNSRKILNINSICFPYQLWEIKWAYQCKLCCNTTCFASIKILYNTIK